MSQLWDHIQLDFALVDQVNNKKVDRRRMKLSGTIGYLVEQGVLYDSVPTSGEGGMEEGAGATSPVLEVSARFPILVPIGESFLQYEILQRLSRLMPKAIASDVKTIADFLMHPRQLRALYEMMQINAIIQSNSNLSAPTFSIPPTEKVAILLAMLGEMRLYCAKDRRHSIADKIGADELVLNVLSNHCCENLVSELVHSVLQRIVDEGTPVWNEFRFSEQSYLFNSGASVPSPVLSSMPAPLISQKDATDMAVAADQSMKSFILSPKNIANVEAEEQLDTPVCKLAWQDLAKSCSMETQLPGAPNKHSTFAATLPKLGARYKK